MYLLAISMFEFCPECMAIAYMLLDVPLHYTRLLQGLNFSVETICCRNDYVPLILSRSKVATYSSKFVHFQCYALVI